MNTYIGNNAQNYWGQIYLLPFKQGEETVGNYAAWIQETIAAGELIRKSLQWGQLTGSPRFVDEIEKEIERRVEIKSVPLILFWNGSERRTEGRN